MSPKQGRQEWGSCSTPATLGSTRLARVLGLSFSIALHDRLQTRTQTVLENRVADRLAESLPIYVSSQKVGELGMAVQTSRPELYGLKRVSSLRLAWAM